MLFLLFDIAGDRYALESAQVHEIVPMLHEKRIPGAPPGIFGLVRYREQNLPVVDVSALATGVPARARASTRIAVLHYRQVQASQRLLGLLVERVTSVFHCQPEAFRESGVTAPGAPYLGPVTRGPEGIVQWLRMEQLLSAELTALLYPEARAP